MKKIYNINRAPHEKHFFRKNPTFSDISTLFHNINFLFPNKSVFPNKSSFNDIWKILCGQLS